MMKEDIKKLLASELYSAVSYLDRLLQAITTMTALYQRPRAREIALHLYEEITKFFRKNLIKLPLQEEEVDFDMKALRAKIRSSHYMMETLLKLDFDSEETAIIAREYINLIYLHSHFFHHFCLDNSNLDIEFPRLALLEVQSKVKIHGDRELPLFALSERLIDELKGRNLSVISSLDWQRDKKYDFFIDEGHKQIFNKHYKQALNCFKKALTYKRTAQAYNLVAWAHSLMGEVEKAKSFCLKAIKLDPEFGPPYNDLGTYLLNEGQIQESIKWFELAKKATHYQNREYPYINAGRAYMAMNKHEKAIKEFNEAIALAPYQEELKKTIRKLKQFIGQTNDGEDKLSPVQ